MVTRRLLTHDANGRLRDGDLENAERELIALVRSAPHDLNARLRIADGLLAAGVNDAAIAGYMFVAREAAVAGYPLKSVIALKVLAQIDPAAEVALAALAQRYGAGSTVLGRSVRVAPPDPDAEVPSAAFIPNELSPEAVYQLAGQVVASREGMPGIPPTVAPIPLLSDLPADAFARLLHAVELRRVAAGEVVIREGEPGDAFYMIARGGVRVTRGGASVATLGEGALFGEMALVSGAPRTATVTATEDTDVLLFGREALRAVARELTVVATALDRFTRERLLNNLLATHPVFKPFDRAQRAQLATRFSAHDVAAGTVLIREGETGRGLFLLLNGEVEVSKQEGAERLVLATLGSGDVLGEIALIENGATTATVTATRPSTVFFLARDVFEKLVSGVPELRAYFEQLAEERQMDTNIAIATRRAEEAELLDDSEIVVL